MIRGFHFFTPSRSGSLHRTVLIAALAGLAMIALGAAGSARADRWGTPYSSQVSAAQTVVYARADFSSPPVGPLGRGAIVVVVDTTTGADGTHWSRIPDGFIPSRDLSEMVAQPWTAELSVPSAEVRAYPYPTSTLLRTARQGDLFRVMGVSKGLDGDTGLWWATSAGYVPMGTLKWATNDWAHWWKLPESSDAPKGWWGVLVQQARVRPAPSTQAPLLGMFGGGEYVKVLSEEQGEALDGSALWYRIDGGRYAGGYIHSTVVRRLPDPRPNTTPPDGASARGSWIVVDKSSHTLTFVRDGAPLFATHVSLGKAGVDTPGGTYLTFGKFTGDRMSSRNVENPSHPYDLPNVPFTQYYKDGGYAIHGTYWHDVFGTNESQGCINLTLTDAAYLFGLTLPVLPANAMQAWGTGANTTPVVITE